MPRPRYRILAALGLALVIAAVVAVAGTGGGSTRVAAPSSAAGAPGSVAIKNFLYGPNPVHVRTGTSIRFTNLDGVEHTATGDSSGGFDTGALQHGQSMTVRLTTAGTYAYHCSFHPFMHGTIIVR